MTDHREERCILYTCMYSRYVCVLSVLVLAPSRRYNQVTLQLGTSKVRLADQVHHGSVDGAAP
jgi:hypothetical protein